MYKFRYNVVLAFLYLNVDFLVDPLKVVEKTLFELG